MPSGSSSRASSSSSPPTSVEGTRPLRALFSTGPLKSRRPQKLCHPGKYVAAAAQVVHFGVEKLPMVARVTLVDYRGNILLDTFVQPTQIICDYRTHETGLRPVDLVNAPSLQQVQSAVSAHLRGKILVGHSLWNFLQVLGLSHPAIDTRDTALFMPFRRSLRWKPTAIVPLTTLVHRLMGRAIGQQGENSIEQARACIDLFRSCEQVWESIIKSGSWPCSLPPTAYGNYFT